MGPSNLARLGLLALLSAPSFSAPITHPENFGKRAAALCSDPDISWEQKQIESCPICVDKTIPPEVYSQHCQGVLNPAVFHLNVDSIWRRDAPEAIAIEDAKHPPADVPTSSEAHGGDPTITEPAILRRDDWNINLPPGVEGHSQMAVMHAVQQAVYKRRPLLDEGVVPTTTTSTNAKAATEIPEQHLPHEIDVAAAVPPIERPLDLYPGPRIPIPRLFTVTVPVSQRSSSNHVPELRADTYEPAVERGATGRDLNLGIPPKLIPEAPQNVHTIHRRVATLPESADSLRPLSIPVLPGPGDDHATNGPTDPPTYLAEPSKATKTRKTQYQPEETQPHNPEIWEAQPESGPIAARAEEGERPRIQLPHWSKPVMALDQPAADENEITARDRYIDQPVDVVYVAGPHHAESSGPDMQDNTLFRRLDKVVHIPAPGLYKAAENVQEAPEDEARHAILPRSDRVWQVQETQWSGNSRNSPDSDTLFSLQPPDPVTHQPANDIWRRIIKLEDDEESRSKAAHQDDFSPGLKLTPVWPPEMLGPGPVVVESERQRRNVAKSVDALSSHEQDPATLDPGNNAATIVHQKANDVWRRDKPYTTVSSSRSISTDESSSKPEAEELFDQSTSALQGVNRHNNIVEIHHPAPMIYRRSSTQWQPPSVNEGSWDEKSDISNKDGGGIPPAENGIVSAASMDSVMMHPVLDIYRRRKATSLELANDNQLQTMHEISVVGARSPRENNDDEPDERFDMPTLGDEATAHEPAHHLYKIRTQRGRKRSIPAPELFEKRPWPFRSSRVMQRRSRNKYKSVQGDLQNGVNVSKNIWDNLDKNGNSGMQKRSAERSRSAKNTDPGISLMWEKLNKGGDSGLHEDHIRTEVPAVQRRNSAKYITDPPTAKLPIPPPFMAQRTRSGEQDGAKENMSSQLLSKQKSLTTTAHGDAPIMALKTRCPLQP